MMISPVFVLWFGQQYYFWPAKSSLDDLNPSRLLPSELTNCGVIEGNAYFVPHIQNHRRNERWNKTELTASEKWPIWWGFPNTS